jgi:amidohydrolase
MDCLVTTDASMNIDAALPPLLPQITQLRHRLHAIPELSDEEYKTAALIREELTRACIPFTTGGPEVPTTTVALIGDPARPCVALRADIDALPVEEQTAASYASVHPGRMHACGHDGHAAILLGTALLLRHCAAELPVCVKLIWQPAEEIGGGARRLVRAGVLDGRWGPPVRAIFGLHGWPTLPMGTVSTKPGPLFAATDSFAATFVGRGCHGAFPHRGRDPIVAACEVVLNLQQCVSRELDPAEPGLVTVGTVHGGSAVNIIPNSARITGTVRTLTAEPRRLFRESIERRCAGIASAQGCRLEFEWTEGYPATTNDAAMAEYCAVAAKQALGADRIVAVARPSMAGEDFAFYLEKVPGCFFLLGVCPAGQDSYHSLHSSRYDFPDAALEAGIRIFLSLVVDFPRTLKSNSQQHLDRRMP